MNLAQSLDKMMDQARRLNWRMVAFILAVKALIFIFGVQSYQLLSGKRIATFYGWLEIWNRWDAPHYLSIARLGYRAVGEERFFIIFYPLFAWATRLFAFIFGDHLISAIVVSALASIAAGLLLERLVHLDYATPELAQRAVWFLFIFPTSYFLHIGYTESLFLTLALGSFLAARRERWLLAGILGALACLTRINGLILTLALAVEAFQQYRTLRRWRWQWLWLCIIPSGFGLYLLINYQVTGDAFRFLAIGREHWFKSLTWPWVGIRGTYNAMWRNPAEAMMVGVQEMFFIVLGLVCTVWCWIKLRPSYGVWMTANWLLFVSTSFILSVPRYTLILFPIYILFARLAGRGRVWFGLLTVWSLMFLSLFVGQFVQGLWAF